jgi:cupin 2 domain-containing protein
MLRGKLRSNLPSAADAADRPEAVDVLARGPSTRVERIVSNGHASPPGFWYDQTENEYVVLLAGRAELEVEGIGNVTLEPGDRLDIPARLRRGPDGRASGRPLPDSCVSRPRAATP